MTPSRLRLIVVVVLTVLMMGTMVVEGSRTVLAQAQPAQEEFVPLEQVPPEDQLPAAPLLVTAYALIWVAVFGYLWSIWRRMATVERELDLLAKRARD